MIDVVSCGFFRLRLNFLTMQHTPLVHCWSVDRCFKGLNWIMRWPHRSQPCKSLPLHLVFQRCRVTLEILPVKTYRFSSLLCQQSNNWRVQQETRCCTGTIEVYLQQSTQIRNRTETDIANPNTFHHIMSAAFLLLHTRLNCLWHDGYRSVIIIYSFIYVWLWIPKYTRQYYKFITLFVPHLHRWKKRV